MHYSFKTNLVKTLSDTFTPVGLFLKLRDRFPHSFLLESSEYNTKENSYSYLCFDPIATFKATTEKVTQEFPNGDKLETAVKGENIASLLHGFSQQFKTERHDLGFVTSGLFGYTSYNAIPLFEDINFRHKDFDLPLIHYHFFRFIIVFNHFKNELFIVEQQAPNEPSKMKEIEHFITNRSVPTFPFATVGQEKSNFSDDEFLEKIKIGKKHCFLGDVFQVVFARKFRQKFKGDEFNVYRALRSINPSPYLFYFDYGSFKLFGSSPEAQLTIHNHKATINPIAGTFKRTGNVAEDNALAEELSNDPKENAEHVMLVDLARNDLSVLSKNVAVQSFKKVEFYSHVIHLVSKVTAQLENNVNPIEVLGHTYPAGTLSGAPKYKAMELIDKHEPESRGFYGGVVGIIGLDGSFNHAIFIRSFLSRNNTLHYQAGCGIVSKSDEQSELQEVSNKLEALRKAIALAGEI